MLNWSDGVVNSTMQKGISDSQTVVLSLKPPATDLGLPILWYNWARKPEIHQNHIMSSGYRDHKFWSGILRAKRKLENAARENMTMAGLVMLYQYGVIVQSPMPPMVLRERASIALGTFPGNSIILGLSLEGEKGQGVWGKARGMLGDNEVDVGKIKDVAHEV